MPKGDKHQQAREAMSQRLRLVLSLERVETNSDAANYFGLPISTVKNWLNGVFMPPPLSLLPLVEAGYSLDWLYFGRGVPRVPSEPKPRSSGMRVAGGVA